MEPLYKYRGGGSIGKNSILGWGALFDFSTLELYEDKLILRAWPIRIEILYAKIDSIEEISEFMFPSSPKRKKILKINHQINLPSYLIFFSKFGNSQDILNFFKKRGISIKSTDKLMDFHELYMARYKLALPAFLTLLVLSVIVISIIMLFASISLFLK